MADLSDLVARRAQATNIVRGKVANTITDPLADDLYVTVEAFDGHRQRWGPCQWTPGSCEPERGQDCLVVFDEDEAPWVLVDDLVLADVDASVSATTKLTPGSNATASVTEPTPNHFAFAFGIPVGSKWWSAAGAPAAATGAVGDFYLNSTTGDYYEKTAASTWTLRGNLKGPQGVQGIQGPQGPQGIQGPQGPAGPSGSTLSAWNGIALANGWQDYGAPYTRCQWRRDSAQNKTYLRGLANHPTNANQYIAVLPYVPSYAHVFVCMTSLGPQRVELQTNAIIGPAGWNPGGAAWIDLDDIYYFTD